MREKDSHTKGVSRKSFWVPTLDKRGGLLLLAAFLYVFHHSELLGIHQSDVLLFNWLPVGFAYHSGLGLVYIGFILVLYYNWPDAAVNERIDEIREPAEKKQAAPEVIEDDAPEDSATDGGSDTGVSEEVTRR